MSMIILYIIGLLWLGLTLYLIEQIAKTNKDLDSLRERFRYLNMEHGSLETEIDNLRRYASDLRDENIKMHTKDYMVYVKKWNKDEYGEIKLYDVYKIEAVEVSVDTDDDAEIKKYLHFIGINNQLIYKFEYEEVYQYEEV